MIDALQLLSASRFKGVLQCKNFWFTKVNEKLKHHESLYLFKRRFEKPFTIPQPDRISVIIGDITDEKWQIALATKNSNTVGRTIDRAPWVILMLSAVQKNKRNTYKISN
ncbi:hypothetical protein NPIL_579851 [Nephila pilipes]|uniref:Uncharacterized protein n=1 Tax=Nephila pilipes TaxID=299642 RepID=A0A8X6T556_NEPPI|nr:hypothetical protein NPIL_579851 [Nephila pilipes]